MTITQQTPNSLNDINIDGHARMNVNSENEIKNLSIHEPFYNDKANDVNEIIEQPKKTEIQLIKEEEPQPAHDAQEEQMPKKKGKKKGKKGKNAKKKRQTNFEKNQIMSIEEQGLASIFIQEDPKQKKTKRVPWWMKK